MYFQHIYDPTLAQASYFIGCQKEGVAIVIDPKRDVDTYLEIAGKNKMRITHIAETHIHADFLCGSRELAHLTGAQLYLSDEGGKDWQYEFEHIGLKDKSTFMVGNLKFEVMHTPGHTPESISFLLTDVPACKDPVMIFTGDFVFVGDIGRPDLLEEAAGIKGTKEAGAREMYRSLKKFSALPDFVQVWPGHGAGSACGKALGAVPSSTVGYEKIRNWAFQFENDEEGFIKNLLEDQPEAPKYFGMMKKINRIQRRLINTINIKPALSATELADAVHHRIKIIDTRPKAEFSKGHIPGSYNIQNNQSLATWAGWFLNYDESFIIVAPENTQEEITRKLMRIGLDNIEGFVSDIKSWEKAGHRLSARADIGCADVEKLRTDPHTKIIDLRGETEFKAGHIPGAQHVFIGHIENHLDMFGKNGTVIVHCQAGDRSSLGASVLARHGIDVKNYPGGYADWIANGNPVTQ